MRSCKRQSCLTMMPSKETELQELFCNSSDPLIYRMRQNSPRYFSWQIYNHFSRSSHSNFQERRLVHNQRPNNGGQCLLPAVLFSRVPSLLECSILQALLARASFPNSDGIALGVLHHLFLPTEVKLDLVQCAPFTNPPLTSLRASQSWSC